MAAADEAELVHMVATAAEHDEGPIAFRYPRGEGVGVEMPESGVPLAIGKGRIVREGESVALLSFGAHLSECLKGGGGTRGNGHHRHQSPTPASPSRSTPTSSASLPGTTPR